MALGSLSRKSTGWMKLEERGRQVAVFVIIATEYFWTRDASVKEVPISHRFFNWASSYIWDRLVSIIKL